MSLPSINSVPPVVIDETQKARLLEIVAADTKIGTVNAAREAGVVGSRSRIREAVVGDEELTAQLEEARGRGPEAIRAEIRRRAIDGVEKDVWHNGEVVGSEIVTSDRMLAMMAKANLPEYQDTMHVEVTGDGGGPIEVEGRAIVGLGDVLSLAGSLGISPTVGVDAGPARDALPGPTDVLSDPPVGERTAGALPAPRPD